jgi:4-oxalomesaconate tautomerase
MSNNRRTTEPVLRAIPATLMRGGTSKGLYFNARDLPRDPAARDRILLAAMGSPDSRQIDGVGGAHPLTSKVAVIGKSSRPEADVDYLFLQVSVDKAEVSDSQNCGNLLAGVGPWAIEQGLVPVTGPITPIRIYMVNTASFAVVYVQTPAGQVEYEGDARIDGVPGRAAPINIEFLDVAGSSCGALFPTGSVVDVVDGIQMTCIDNGMPVVILKAADLGLTGTEDPAAIEANRAICEKIEALRLQIGPRMNLGDVTRKTVPKMSLIAPATRGGTIATRTLIPHRVHEAIGVLGAVSVATACLAPGSVAAQCAGIRHPNTLRKLDIEHPTGFFTVEIDASVHGDTFKVERAMLLRTARKLMAGELFVPSVCWDTP